MFSVLNTIHRREQSVEDSEDQQESQSFLPSTTDSEKEAQTREYIDTAGPWRIATAVTSVLLLLSLASQVRKGMTSMSTYESGFETDLRKLTTSNYISTARLTSTRTGHTVNSTAETEILWWNHRKQLSSI